MFPEVSPAPRSLLPRALGSAGLRSLRPQAEPRRGQCFSPQRRPVRWPSWDVSPEAWCAARGVSSLRGTLPLAWTAAPARRLDTLPPGGEQRTLGPHLFPVSRVVASVPGTQHSEMAAWSILCGFKRVRKLALAGGRLSWLERRPVPRKAEALVRGQGARGGGRSMFLSHVGAPLSPPPFLSLKSVRKHVLLRRGLQKMYPG